MKKTLHLKYLPVLLTALAMLLACTLLIGANNHVGVAHALDNVIEQMYPTDYDAYTDTDSFSYNGNEYDIRQYATSTELLHGGMTINDEPVLSLTDVSDNAIVQIIPKELFMTNGDVLQIGKEYGFFIHTENFDPDSNKQATVIIFDVTYTNPYMMQTNGVIEISVQPILQRQYIYLSPENHTYHFSSTSVPQVYACQYTISEGCVVPSIFYNNIPGNDIIYDYDYFDKSNKRYYLKDISYGIAVSNEQDANENNTGYYSKGDIGSFITSFDYKYSGTIIKRDGLSTEDWFNIIKDGVVLASGFIPYVGPAISIMDYLLDTGITLACKLTPYEDDINNGEITAVSFFDNRDDQIDNYGSIQKAAAAVLQTDTDNSVLFKVGDKASGYFNISHSALNGQHPNYTRIISNIGLTVVKSDGSPVCSGNNSCVYRARTYESKELKLEKESRVYLQPYGNNYFEFTPDCAGDYDILIKSPTDIKATINNEYVEGQKTSDGTHHRCYLQSGTTYFIALETNETAVDAPIVILPNTDVSNISLKANEPKLFKISASGLKSLNVSGDAYVENVLTLNQDGNLERYPNIITPLHTNRVDIMFNSDAYVVLNCSEDTTCSIKLAEIESVGTTHPATLEVGPDCSYRYLKFTQSEDSMIFSITDAQTATAFDKTIDVVVIDENGDSKSGTFWKQTVGAYQSYASKGTYYIGFLTQVNANIKISMSASKTAYEWKAYITEENGGEKELTLDSDSQITLPLSNKTQNFRFEFIINHEVVARRYRDVTGIKGVDFDDETGILTVTKDCTAGTSFQLKSYVVDIPATYILELQVYIKFIITDFEFDGIDYINAMRFSWIPQADIDAYEFDVAYYKENSTSPSHGQIKVAAAATDYDLLGFLLNEKATGDATVRLLSITVNDKPIDVLNRETYEVNGHYVVYLSDKDHIELNCMYSGHYVSGKLIPLHYYYISNELQLTNIRYDMSYTRHIDNDITLTREWVPIPDLKCNLYGNDYKIKNLYFTLGEGKLPYTDYGLVGINEAIIGGVYIEGINIQSAEGQHFSPTINVGGIAGTNKGYISMCTVTGQINVHRSYSRIGGIVGLNDEGLNIYSCTFGSLASGVKSVLNGNGDTGGIAGKSIDTIDECRVENVDIKHYTIQDSRSIGGIVGYGVGGSITDCTIDTLSMRITNTGQVSGLYPKMGYVVGHMEYGEISAISGVRCSHNISALSSDSRKYAFNGGGNGSWAFFGKLVDCTVDGKTGQTGP